MPLNKSALKSKIEAEMVKGVIVISGEEAPSEKHKSAVLHV